MLQLILYIIVATLIGLMAFSLFRFRMPGGATGSIVAALLGVWIGDVVLLWELGPQLAGYHIVPSVIGATVVVLAVGLLARRANIVR
ncbi:GlsB/YeaQ/YmgE family stress response membrane protein [Virgibacillus soli]|uniref:GlsB/YeaQ/YmgE family stress response membrane protein n=1 Tax=Paracerasibacillus soli TaxID=480284 RepID=A0ABU5CTG3_9BACI|nr:GlsB/YeaQ/YmgE family stress response membrane protein [Virgibacillus soli]MDY0409535.1 GlsB/YeaQ/YmgE family stress response membrane protein [Virgibacillus soli]